MTYLDTHVVIWLAGGEEAKLSEAAAGRIQDDDIFVSPAVVLELELLYEIKRVKAAAAGVIRRLSTEIGLSVCQLPFAAVVEHALDQRWVRDPFDRLIVAHASANSAALITKDEKIRRHYRRAVW